MKSRNIGLDYVRATAILCVLLCHFSIIYIGSGTGLYPMGIVGVELFFVLSGYLIGGILLRSIADNEGTVNMPLIGRFWARRWMRTLPSYLLALCALTAFGNMPVNRLPAYLTFSQNLAWGIPKSFELSWSLAVEEWFYLLLPLAAIVAERISGKKRGMFLGVSVLFLLVPTILRVMFANGREWDNGVRRLVVFRLDSIMWGVLLSYIQRYHMAWYGKLCNWMVAVAGVVTLIATYVYLLKRFDNHVTFISHGLVDSLILTMISIGCVVLLPWVSTWKRSWPLVDGIAVRISHWSYAIYISHTEVIRLVNKVALKCLPGLSPMLTASAAFCLILLLAFLIFKFFETPILGLRDRVFPDQRSTASSRIGTSEGRSQLGNASVNVGQL
jgi:peptidoglycan/LPS O-acetylase OafA/YrhL